MSANATKSRIKVGYLHLGPTEHGIHRYGRLLAAAVSQQPDVDIREVSVMLSGTKEENAAQLLSAARSLAGTDVIHTQFSKFNRQLWGEGHSQLHALRCFSQQCSMPLVATLHDVFYPENSFKRLRNELSKPSKPSLTSTAVQLRRSLRNMIDLDMKALAYVNNRFSKLFVCTNEESSRVWPHVEGHRLKTISHFVERRSLPTDREQVRSQLALGDRTTITLLGFIYPTKGHDLMVEALPHLPESVQLVFAGGASSDKYKEYVMELQATAAKLGVADRLRVTGFLSEEDLEKYLVATDIAVCPFSRFSASGSLSSWISVGCPILASKAPQISEYNQIVPAAIDTFSPYSAEAIAHKISSLIAKQAKGHPDRAVESDPVLKPVLKLREKLSIDNIARQHLHQYREVIGQ